MTKRYRILPDHGTLLVSTDVHGCLEDFERMRARWEKAHAADPDVHWAILGDVVHAPSPGARERIPELYDYDDGSWEIVRQIGELTTEHPHRVHFVIGNHDYAHIGGPRTAKFYDDEAGHLESMMTDDQIDRMHAILADALICLLAPCGAFLAHASPGALFDSLDEIDAIDLAEQPEDDRQRGLMRHLTTMYGQREAVTRSFLRSTSELAELDLTFVVHGHDRDEEGWFAHEETQICPVIFGAPRENKRYLRLDLGAHYGSVHDLRDGEEIRRLWSDE